jgi:ProP effector
VGGNKNAETTIAELVLVFPAAFTRDPASVRPLEVGIKDDVYARCDTSHRGITAALRSYCNSVDYLKASTQGAVRVDLVGQPAGIVTEAEARHAMKALAALAKSADNHGSKAVRNAPAEAVKNNTDTRYSSPPSAEGRQHDRRYGTNSVEPS